MHQSEDAARVARERSAVDTESSGIMQPAVSSTPALARRRLLLFHLLLYLLTAASLGYLYFLPHHPHIAQLIYTDENAWTADGVAPRITSAHLQWAQREHERLVDAQGSERRVVLEESWGALGLEPLQYRHQHSAGSEWAGEETVIIYAVVESRMGDGKEAVVLLADYDISQHSTKGSQCRGCGRTADVDRLCYTGAAAAGVLKASSAVTSGAALLTGLAAYLYTVPWLSRDVIVIAVENNNNQRRAVEALGGWLHTYRSPASANSSYSAAPFRRCGGILAALCIDIPLLPASAPVSSAFSIHCGGPYGLQPNLDIVAVLLTVLRERGVTVAVADNFPPSSPLSSQWKDRDAAWVRSWDALRVLSDDYRGLMRSAVHHVTGEATGYHGHFIHNNIDAVTISLLPAAAASSTSAFPTGSLLVSLDVFLHALNNLIEKLHHSTWLYLLLSPTHFVTMSKYIYAFVLLMAHVPLLALHALYSTPDHDWLGAAIAVITVYSACLLPVLLSQAGVGSSAAVAAGLVAVLAAVAAVWQRRTAMDWWTVHAFAWLLTFLALSPLAILNFSLCIAMLLLIAPITLCIAPHRQRKEQEAATQQASRGGVASVLRTARDVAVLCAVSPLSALALYAQYWQLSWPVAVLSAVRGLSFSSNLLYLLLPGVYLPVYLLCWLMVLAPQSSFPPPSCMQQSAAATEAVKKLQ